MTKEQAQQLEPFDIVTVKGQYGKPDQDALVKSVGSQGVFCLLRIQSTAELIPFEDIY